VVWLVEAEVLQALRLAEAGFEKTTVERSESTQSSHLSSICSCGFSG
jgi:hypothetical protein